MGASPFKDKGNRSHNDTTSHNSTNDWRASEEQIFKQILKQEKKKKNVPSWVREGHVDVNVLIVGDAKVGV
jgi:hypothetical protein